MCIEKEDVYKNIVEEFNEFVGNNMFFWDSDGKWIRERWENIKDKYIEKESDND